MDPSFRLTAYLVDGQKIIEEFTEEGAAALLARERHHYIIDAKLSPHQQARALVYTELAVRLSEARGYVGLHDVDRRHWMVPPTSIVAIMVEDLVEPTVGGIEDYLLKRREQYE